MGRGKRQEAPPPVVNSDSESSEDESTSEEETPNETPGVNWEQKARERETENLELKKQIQDLLKRIGALEKVLLDRTEGRPSSPQEMDTEEVSKKRPRKNSSSSSDGEPGAKPAKNGSVAAPAAKKVAPEPQTPPAEEEQRPQPQDKRDKIPPVHMANTKRWTLVSKELDRKKIRFTKARTTANGIAIHPASVSDHRALTKFFAETREEYFTYSLEEEKSTRAVIRGIPDGVSIKEIEADLSSQGIIPLSTTRMVNRRTKQAMPLVLVQVSKENKKIFEVTRCCQLVVRVEEQRAQAEPTQCHRCQRFGHAQSRCTVAARCVKCAGAHHSGDCPKPRTEKAKCANCSGEHPASYRGCPKHPTSVAKQAKRTTTQKETPPAPRRAQPQPAAAAPTAGPSGQRQPVRSYAGAAKAAPKASQDNTAQSAANLMEVVQKLHKLPGLIDFLLQAQEMLSGIFNH